MHSPARSALYLAIGAMAFAANDANAGKVCAVNLGYKTCWTVGSEICEVTVNPSVFGLTAPLTLTCDITGAESGCPSGELPTGTSTCGPPPTDDIQLLVQGGQGAQGGPTSNSGKGKGKGKGKGHRCDGDDDDEDENCEFDAQPVLEDPFEDHLFSETVDMTCKGDKCTGKAEVLPPAGSTCEGGGELLDFTADKFIGHVEVCGSEESGCEDFYQECTLSGNAYECTDVTDNVNNYCYD